MQGLQSIGIILGPIDSKVSDINKIDSLEVRLEYISEDFIIFFFKNRKTNWRTIQE